MISLRIAAERGPTETHPARVSTSSVPSIPAASTAPSEVEMCDCRQSRGALIVTVGHDGAARQRRARSTGLGSEPAPRIAATARRPSASVRAFTLRRMVYDRFLATPPSSVTGPCALTRNRDPAGAVPEIVRSHLPFLHDQRLRRGGQQQPQARPAR